MVVLQQPLQCDTSHIRGTLTCSLMQTIPQSVVAGRALICCCWARYLATSDLKVSRLRMAFDTSSLMPGMDSCLFVTTRSLHISIAIFAKMFWDNFWQYTFLQALQQGEIGNAQEIRSACLQACQAHQDYVLTTEKSCSTVYSVCIHINSTWR